MTRTSISQGLLALAAVAGAANAQTHRVEKPDAVVRAVAVYEWTGDLAKPTASRLVPISLFINRTFEDAGIYLARPIPFALETGTVFELEKSGTDAGTLELAFARHIETAQDAPGLHVDDGWFAYGAFKPKPAGPVVVAKKSGKLPVVIASGGKESASATTDAKAGTVDRSTAAGAGTTVSASAPPPILDDGPTKKASDPDSDSAKDDPDRPTLKKRSVAERREAQKKAATASVASAGDLNDDPDRPNLHRGKPVTRLEDDDLPALHGLPPDMHQMIAVSDAKDRPEHDFTRSWESPAEQDQVLTAMRALALAQIGSYKPAANATPTPAKKPVTTPRRTSKTATPTSAVPAGPVLDARTEHLKAYTLSYGGAATFIYSAATPDPKAPVLVTVVAQREPDGSLKTALASVTDASHLDRTPELRLVDVVDPDASNRASLLFERRGATTRDFVLYRVIGAQAEQTMVAGSN